MFLLACASMDTAKDTAPDTADTVAGESADSEVPDVVLFTVGIFDFLTGAALEGAPVVAGDVTGTIGSDGLAVLVLPADTAVAIEVSAPDYPVVRIVADTGQETAGVARTIATHEALGALGDSLGVDYDVDRGLFSVAILTYVDDELVGLVGARAELDLPYDLVLAGDGSSAIGVSPGDTVIDAERPDLTFANVEPGTAHLVVTTPAGESCLVYAGERPAGSEVLVVDADTLTSLTYVCE